MQACNVTVAGAPLARRARDGLPVGGGYPMMRSPIGPRMSIGK